MLNYQYLQPILSYDEISAENLSDQITPIIIDYLDDFVESFAQNHFYKFSKEFYEATEFDLFKTHVGKVCNLKKADERIFVVKGKAGVGKTTFLLLGLCEILGFDPSEALIYLDFREVPQDMEDYTQWIMERINKYVNDLISFKYRESYKAYSLTIEDDGYLEMDILRILFLCKQIGQEKQAPLLFAFDNIDLCSHKTQENIVSAMIQIKSRIYKCIGLSKMINDGEGRISFILTKRPETHFKREQLPFINVCFPTPRILNIYLNSLEKSFEKSCRDKGDVEIPPTFGEGITTIFQLTKHFIDLLKTKYLVAWNSNEANERFGNMEKFHNQIVNSNVRRFIHFIAASIQRGALKPLTQNRFTGEQNPYQLYQYIDLLIRGAYSFHPGNAKMDGEGFYTRSLIIMNLFDFSEWINDRDKVLKNYMVYIRILQYIEIEYEKTRQEVSFSILRDLLIQLSFDKDVIDMATKKMLYANLIDETRSGIRNIAMSDGYKKISLSSPETVFFTAGEESTVGFYLKHLIVEPEYLFNMAVTAPMFADTDDKITKEHIATINSMRSSAIRRVQYCLQHKDRVIYLFLRSIYISINKSVIAHKQCDMGASLQSFKLHFIYNNGNIGVHNYRPWRRMMEQFISILERKLAKATVRNDLQDILSAAKKMQADANQFIDSMFEDQ
ncbi:MAG: hypothetical protein VB099_11175 [Candidatus Limiplasma sp.]|nr:hypothetical protein [Candidatus Limiplasma sp.]